MLKGLAITPPVIGRISIGRVVEKNGKRLPEKDDQFTITTQVQTKDGWVLHPLDETLRKQGGGEKLRTIPVRLPFNDPDLNLRADYHLFDKNTGRPFCVGNGDTCRRATDDGIETLECPSPDACSSGRNACKPYGRLNVIIGDTDDLGTFILRTTSYNSIRTLYARMQYYRAASGGLLACMPLELKLRGKSTTQSHRSAIYYIDLVVPSGMTLADAVKQAKQLDEKRKEAGVDQAALDEAARSGFANGAFEESVEDVPAVVEEFYPSEPAGSLDSSDSEDQPEPGTSPATLKGKLDKRMASLAGQSA